MGRYADNKSINITLPVVEDDVWISFTLAAGEQIYARCSYHSSCEGMSVEKWDDSSSTRTFYIHVNRGTATGSSGNLSIMHGQQLNLPWRM